MDDGIIVIPKPKDPVKELEEIGKSLPDKPIEELKKEILKQAMKELGWPTLILLFNFTKAQGLAERQS